ncbi:MAG: hypothetical protein K6L73_04805 [Cellvibrionaceae bacterium]
MFVSVLSTLYLFYLKGEPPLPAILCMYLLVTSWLTVSRPVGIVSKLDVCLTGVISIISVGLFIYAYCVKHAMIDGFGVPASIFFIFSGLAGLCAVLDIHMIVRKGVWGRQRIIRHLWRMLMALFLAMMAVAAQKNVYPQWMIESKVMVLPLFFILVLLVFWVFRVAATDWWERVSKDSTPFT